MPSYDASAIVTHSGLAIVRENPTAYLPDLERDGQYHLILEGTDNSFDEMMALQAMTGHLGYVNILIARDTENGKYQIIIRDNGRGIPLGKNPDGNYALVACATIPNSSGKFKVGAYHVSGGQFGWGLKVTIGLSKLAKVITQCRNGTESLFVHDGLFDPTPDIDSASNEHTGVTVVYQPDPQFFSDVDKFTNVDYVGIIELMKRKCFFFNVKVSVSLIDELMPEEFWSADIPRSLELLEQQTVKSDELWNSKDFDKTEWIKAKWDIRKPITYEFEFQKPKDKDCGPLVDYRIMTFFVDGLKGRDYFSLVNGIYMTLADSHQFSVYLNELTKYLAAFIDDEAVREYFLKQYRLPVFLAIDVKYSGAKFSKATKDSFKKDEFRKLYKEEIDLYFDSQQGRSHLAHLFSCLRDDIQNSYYETLGGKKIRIKDMGMLFASLDNSKRFRNCRNKDRSQTELIMVEGRSAAMPPFDGDNQGIFLLTGKPLNATKLVTGDVHSREYRSRVTKKLLETKSAVYKDFFTAINYDPRNPDMSELNFNSACILTDGDIHGRHITSILMTNFAIVCPELVAAGFFNIIIPPYYSVNFVGNDDEKLFVRAKDDISQWCVRYVLTPLFDLGIRPRNSEGELKILSERAFSYAIYRTMRCGAIYDNIAERLATPAWVVEALARNLNLVRGLGRSDSASCLERLRDKLPEFGVRYDDAGHVLYMSYERADYVVPLDGVVELLEEKLIPELLFTGWYINETYIINKKQTLDTKRVTPVTVYQLYGVISDLLKRTVHVEVLKGLGSIDDAYGPRTCLDPRNRKSFNIRSIGDLDAIHAVMARDSQSRKDLALSGADLIAQSLSED